MLFKIQKNTPIDYDWGVEYLVLLVRGLQLLGNWNSPLSEGGNVIGFININA